ncbi:MAG: decarboxylating NADP(+)-dependent phosphogluconate dehydrogenase [Chitinivibrionales bacterium]
MGNCDIGVIGLAVMGENLVLNMESRGFSVAVYNRTHEKVERFINTRGKEKEITGTYSLKDLTAALKPPRRVMLMVKAGGAVDAVIEDLIPLLDKGDIIIDGGNSRYEDTERRMRSIEEKGLRYIGTGISGGEEGALKGPSIMPGGSPGAWKDVKPLFQSIAADAPDATPCCEWIGSGGAGHFVKMVHNGIEYGDMQVIAEAYGIMRDYLGMDNMEIKKQVSHWNRGDLKSYLTEITQEILGHKEGDTGYTLDSILDTAGQKGTGKWAVISALNHNVPLTLISESVFARTISSERDERAEVSGIYKKEIPEFKGEADGFLRDLENAVLASKIVSYAQGFSLIRRVSSEKGWGIDSGTVAHIWQGGCIIRSGFLTRIEEAFKREPGLSSLLKEGWISTRVKGAEQGWRRVVSGAQSAGIPLPAISSALGYFDALRTERLPSNMIQAQRDYFGAHLYERRDRERGEFFHTNWTGKGGDTSSSAYSV